MVLAPSARLGEFVANYVVIDEAVTRESPIVATPVVSLDFLFGDRARVFNQRISQTLEVPLTVVRGPQTQRWVDLQPMLHHAAFFVRFEPGGFHRLFGANAFELTDHCYSGMDVIGPDVGALHDAIAEASTVRAKARIVETFLLARAAVARREETVHRAARLLTASRGGFNLARLADACRMSGRQFRRHFVRQLGMSPKHYGKIERFSYALRLKEQRPCLSWAQVSAESGYFDQMHLVKDCKLLGGAFPTHLMDIAAMRPLREEPNMTSEALGPIFIDRPWEPPYRGIQRGRARQSTVVGTAS